MEIAKLILDYLKVFLSSSVIGGAVAVTFLCFFKDDIRTLIRRIAKIRFPGGSELSTSQLEKTNEAPPAKEEPPTPVEAPSLPQNISLGSKDLETISQLLGAERARAALWEYRYLNFFLARRTQEFLDWLANLPIPTTVMFADAFWMPSVPDANERKAVLNALMTHHLVQLKGELIEVTPKGKEYIKWRGPLLPVKG